MWKTIGLIAIVALAVLALVSRVGFLRNLVMGA